MKKLVSLIIFSILIFGGSSANAYTSQEINNAANRFYTKVERTYDKAEDRINILEKVRKNISKIRNGNWNRLSDSSKDMINILDRSINKKIAEYKKDIKEELSFDDIFGDLGDSSSENINQNVFVDSGGGTSRGVYKANVGDEEYLGQFRVSGANKPVDILINFKHFIGNYPNIYFSDIYLKDTNGSKYSYDKTKGSLGGVANQQFNNLKSGTYKLYGIIKAIDSSNEKYEITIRKSSEYSIRPNGGLISKVEYKNIVKENVKKGFHAPSLTKDYNVNRDPNSQTYSLPIYIYDGESEYVAAIEIQAGNEDIYLNQIKLLFNSNIGNFAVNKLPEIEIYKGENKTSQNRLQLRNIKNKVVGNELYISFDPILTKKDSKNLIYVKVNNDGINKPGLKLTGFDTKGKGKSSFSDTRTDYNGIGLNNGLRTFNIR